MSRRVMPMVLGIVLLGVAVDSRDGWAIPVTIDFSGLPGHDGIPGTLDDVPFTARDFLYSCCGPGEPLEGSARRLDTEYRGVQFRPGMGVVLIGGGFNPDGTPASPQWSLTLDIHGIGQDAALGGRFRLAISGAAMSADISSAIRSKDPLGLKGVLDVDTPQFGAETGYAEVTT